MKLSIILKWSGNRINAGQSKLWTFNLHRKMNALSCLLTRVKETSCKQTDLVSLGKKPGGAVTIT